MSFLSRLFGKSDSGNSPKDIDAELTRLEEAAEDARPGYVGTAFNKAGDLALKDGQGDRAVAYYGRAIDAFLEDGQRELARGVANKIIRVRPAAIRTLCTLTWLDLAARHQAMALLHLRDYANVANDGGFGTRAATQVYAMARLSADAQFLGAAADALDMLGFPNRATEVRQWTGGDSTDAITDVNELNAACLEAAIRSNDNEAELITDDVEGAPVTDDADGGSAESGARPEDQPSAGSEPAAEDEAAVQDEPTAEDEAAAEDEPVVEGDADGSDAEPPITDDSSDAEAWSETAQSDESGEKVSAGESGGQSKGKKSRKKRKKRKGKKR